MSKPLLSRLLASRVALARSYTSSSLLINQSESKYQFLKDLGIKEQNPGVFDGEWKGSGEVSISLRRNEKKSWNETFFKKIFFRDREYF